MPAKLKVYRTAIGFHDAYVAAASQKAALEAWGTDKPLFARGAAEMVDDPALTAEPLASPGKVIKRLRGTTAEQIAALPPDKAHRSGKSRPIKAKAEAAKLPKPSRAGLDTAEHEASEMEDRHRRENHDLAARKQALVQEQKELAHRQASERGAVEEAVDKARRAYESALQAWAEPE